MSFVFSVKDSLRASVEAASGGSCTVLYDDKGNPSFMRIIPAFNVEDITGSSSITGEVIGAGDGSTTSFSGYFSKSPKAGTISISYTIGGTAYTASDDGNGNISGTDCSGTVDSNGAFNLTFSTAPDSSTNITADYTGSDMGFGLHPAFSVGGVTKSEIYIGMYQAYVNDSRAYSLPNMDPTTNVDFDTARTYCTNKGTGWHLMTAFEWAAVMLWVLKYGTQPRGNTQYGRAYDATYETGIRGDGGTPGSSSGTPRTNTGSGPKTWRHDGTFNGIADLVGNIWEWNDLFKLVDGQIYCPADNDYTLAEASWTAQGVYFDRKAAGTAQPVLNSSRTQTDEGQSPNYSYINPWTSMELDSGLTAANLLKQLCISPKTTESGGTIPIFNSVVGAVWSRNNGERVPIRGGYWAYTSDAGLAALGLYYTRSYTISYFGFRLAYIG